MTTDRHSDYLASLVRELCKLPRETEWVEFKLNNADPQKIGEYLSALANAAALNGKAFAYLMWGVEDETHRIVGTSFSPAATRIICSTKSRPVMSSVTGCSTCRRVFISRK